MSLLVIMLSLKDEWYNQVEYNQPSNYGSRYN